MILAQIFRQYSGADSVAFLILFFHDVFKISNIKLVHVYDNSYLFNF